MTGVWIKFEKVRLSKNREQILNLLGNEESAILEIESALSRHFALAPNGNRHTEKPQEVRADLVRLASAISTIGQILKNRGQARSLFVEACAEYPEDGTLARFQQLESALFGDGHDIFVEAASAALATLEVTSGRRPSPDKMGRVHLVQAMAAAVAKIGLNSGRGGAFEELVQAVYESAGIENAQGETIKADGDIRAAGF